MRITKDTRRNRRKLSIRSKIYGTQDKPRLTVFRSNSNIYAQIIDDDKGETLLSSSTLDKEVNFKGKCNKESAKAVGTHLAKKAKEKNISSVVFDRNGYLFHGKIKSLADAAREGGLDF